MIESENMKNIIFLIFLPYFVTASEPSLENTLLLNEIINGRIVYVGHNEPTFIQINSPLHRHGSKNSKSQTIAEISGFKAIDDLTDKKLSTNPEFDDQIVIPVVPNYPWVFGGYRKEMKPSPAEVFGRLALEQFLYEPELMNQYQTSPNIYDQNKQYAELFGPTQNAEAKESFHERDERYFMEQHPELFYQTEISNFHPKALNGEFPIEPIAQFLYENPVEEELPVAVQQQIIPHQMFPISPELPYQNEMPQYFGWPLPYAHPLVLPQKPEIEIIPIEVLSMQRIQTKPPSFKETDPTELEPVKKQHYKHHNEKLYKSTDLVGDAFRNKAFIIDKEYTGKRDYQEKENGEKYHEIDTIAEEGFKFNKPELTNEGSFEPTMTLSINLLPKVVTGIFDVMKTPDDSQTTDSEKQYEQNQLSTNYLTYEVNRKSNDIDTKTSTTEQAANPHFILSEDKYTSIMDTIRESGSSLLNLTTETTTVNYFSTSESGNLVQKTIVVENPRVVTTPIKSSTETFIEEIETIEDGSETLASTGKKELTKDIGGAFADESESLVKNSGITSSEAKTLTKNTTVVEDSRYVTSTIRIPAKAITEGIEVIRSTDGHETITKEHELIKGIAGYVQKYIIDRVDYENGTEDLIDTRPEPNHKISDYKSPEEITKYGVAHEKSQDTVVDSISKSLPNHEVISSGTKSLVNRTTDVEDLKDVTSSSEIPTKEKLPEEVDETGHQSTYAEEHREPNLVDSSTSELEVSSLSTQYSTDSNEKITYPGASEISPYEIVNEEGSKFALNAKPIVIEPILKAQSNDQIISSGAETLVTKTIVTEDPRVTTPIIESPSIPSSETNNETNSPEAETLVKKTTIIENPRVVTLTIKLPPKTISEGVELIKATDPSKNQDLLKKINGSVHEYITNISTSYPSDLQNILLDKGIVELVKDVIGKSEQSAMNSTSWSQSSSTENSSGRKSVIQKTTVVEDPKIVTSTIEVSPKIITKTVEVTKTSDGYQTTIDLSKEYEVAKEVGGPVLTSVENSKYPEQV